MKNIKSNKAITLIALVITIVVLIILATVVINLSFGNNGILNRARTATEMYVNAQEKDINEIYSQLLVATDGNVTINMESLEKIILDKTYPVGSIYMSMSSSNPSSTLGGEWEQIGQGKTLVGEGQNSGYTFEVNGEQTTIGATTNPKGEYTHQLTIAEIPSHNHLTTICFGGFGHSVNTGFEQINTTMWTPNASQINSGYAYRTGSTGSDGQHNNIQPYIVTYMWKRTR